MKEVGEIILSSLNHTWVLDLDGSILKHNGYLLDGTDEFLPGAKEFLLELPENDMIIFITSRNLKYKKLTEDFLLENKIRYSTIIYNAPMGERILVNDNKPSGLRMAYACPVERNNFRIEYSVDDTI